MLLHWQTTFQGDFSAWLCKIHIWGGVHEHRDLIRKLNPSMPRTGLRMHFLNIISCLGLRCRVPGCSGITGLSLEVLKASISNCQWCALPQPCAWICCAYSSCPGWVLNGFAWASCHLEQTRASKRDGSISLHSGKHAAYLRCKWTCLKPPQAITTHEIPFCHWGSHI